MPNHSVTVAQVEESHIVNNLYDASYNYSYITGLQLYVHVYVHLY